MLKLKILKPKPKPRSKPRCQNSLILIYNKLYKHFGPQYWWPAESPFEVMTGAILTQNTSWANVEKAIASLKKNKVLAPDKLYRLKLKRLASLIRPAGYYNIKAKRLRNFLKFFLDNYRGSIKKISKTRTPALRRQLLAVNGVGPETADSILLYALNKPVFVVDAYTKRILGRHRLLGGSSDYHRIQGLFMRKLKIRARLFNEYHALLVRLGKDFCLKRNPKCAICPLK